MEEAASAAPHPIDERLKDTWKQLHGLQAKLEHLAEEEPSEHVAEELKRHQGMVDAIDSRRVQGVFGGSPTTEIPAGQAELSEMLQECYKLIGKVNRAVEACVESPGTPATTVHHGIDGSLHTTWKQLKGLMGALERLSQQTPSAEMAESLKHYQGMVDRIDSKRGEGGIFGGSVKEGKIPEGQAELSELLAECYQLIEKCKASIDSFAA